MNVHIIVNRTIVLIYSHFHQFDTYSCLSHKVLEYCVEAILDIKFKLKYSKKFK